MSDIETTEESVRARIQRASEVVTERKFAGWQAEHAGVGSDLYKWLAICGGAALVIIVGLFLLFELELAMVLSIFPTCIAWVIVRARLNSQKEKQLASLLETQAPILGLKFLSDPPGAVPAVIMDFQYLLPGFEGSRHYQCGFEGSWRGVDIALAEIFIAGDDEDDPEWGLVIALAVKTRLRSPVEITRDSGRLVNAIARKFRGNHVTFENAEFERHYEVFSDDDRRTRRLMTRAFIDHIMALPRIDGDRPASMVMTDSLIMVGYWSDEDILPAFSLKKKARREIGQIARTCAEALATAHRIVEILDLPPSPEGFPVRPARVEEEPPNAIKDIPISNLTKMGGY